MSVAQRGVAARTVAGAPGRSDRPDPSLFALPSAVVPTKLQPPYRRPGIIERPRLLARLRAVETPMIAVIAPAGYGKSTIASQFGADGDRPSAWLSADVRDSDSVTLLHDVAAAIDRVAPLDPDHLAAIILPAPSRWSTSVPHLQAAFDETPGLTLIIDDVDQIDQPEAIDILIALARTAHGPGRIVVAGRTVGEIPAARLVAEGILTIVGRDDLALDAVETAGVLAAAGLHLAAADVAGLADSTEGWAAGVYLSALAAADRRRDQAVASPVAPDRLVEEYLRGEVLGRLEPDDVRLLLAASVLDRMCGPLCDALLDRTRSGSALDRLERTNLFLIPLDHDRTWYRFHHLFGDVLRAELERRDPAAAVEYRRRAAAWHDAQGHAEAALEYAMAAGDEEQAAALALRIGQDVLNTGRAGTVRRWFAWFDDRGAGARQPQLASYAAMVFALDGDGARAERWADLADAIPEDVPGAVTGVRSISRVLLARHSIPQLVTEAGATLALVPEGDPWRVAALTSLGIARQLDGDIDGADRILAEAVARWNQTRLANTAVCLALVLLAANALERGDRVSAEAEVRKARSVLVANGLSEQAIAMSVDALDARLALAHGAIEQVSVDIAHAQRLRPRLGHAMPWLSLRARFDLIRVHLALGDGGGARTLMAEVDEILMLRPSMGSLLRERDELLGLLARIRGGQAGASTLTMAELRVLPLLTTHLTFREIGERLFVSQNTVKTQAISIYRKLEATSRSEAIERAEALGLIESGPQRERFIPPG